MGLHQWHLHPFPSTRPGARVRRRQKGAASDHPIPSHPHPSTTHPSPPGFKQELALELAARELNNSPFAPARKLNPSLCTRPKRLCTHPWACASPSPSSACRGRCLPRPPASAPPRPPAAHTCLHEGDWGGGGVVWGRVCRRSLVLRAVCAHGRHAWQRQAGGPD